MQRIKDYHNIQEQNKIRCNVCVTGLLQKEEDRATAAKKLKKVFDYIGVNVSETVLSNIKYVSTKSNGTKAVLTVENSETKRMIIDARAKKGRITSRAVGLGESSSYIFLDEELTQQTYQLFKKAKLQLKNIGFKYVWHRNGNILARKNDNDELIVIKNESVLEDLLG